MPHSLESLLRDLRSAGITATSPTTLDPDAERLAREERQDR